MCLFITYLALSRSFKALLQQKQRKTDRPTHSKSLDGGRCCLTIGGWVVNNDNNFSLAVAVVFAFVALLWFPAAHLGVIWLDSLSLRCLLVLPHRNSSFILIFLTTLQRTISSAKWEERWWWWWCGDWRGTIKHIIFPGRQTRRRENEARMQDSNAREGWCKFQWPTLTGRHLLWMDGRNAGSRSRKAEQKARSTLFAEQRCSFGGYWSSSSSGVIGKSCTNYVYST